MQLLPITPDDDDDQYPPKEHLCSAKRVERAFCSAFLLLLPAFRPSIQSRCLPVRVGHWNLHHPSRAFESCIRASFSRRRVCLPGNIICLMVPLQSPHHHHHHRSSHLADDIVRWSVVKKINMKEELRWGRTRRHRRLSESSQITPKWAAGNHNKATKAKTTATAREKLLSLFTTHPPIVRQHRPPSSDLLWVGLSVFLSFFVSVEGELWMTEKVLNMLWIDTSIQVDLTLWFAAVAAKFPCSSFSVAPAGRLTASKQRVFLSGAKKGRGSSSCHNEICD